MENKAVFCLENLSNQERDDLEMMRDTFYDAIEEAKEKAEIDTLFMPSMYRSLYTEVIEQYVKYLDIAIADKLNEILNFYVAEKGEELEALEDGTRFERRYNNDN